MFGCDDDETATSSVLLDAFLLLLFSSRAFILRGLAPAPPPPSVSVSSPLRYEHTPPHF